MKIRGIEVKGLKKAVGEYQRANAEGHYSPRYGCLMFDVSDGQIWTDEFYSLGHNEWNEYHSKTIIDLGSMIEDEVNMKNVKAFLEDNIDALKRKVGIKE